MKRRYALTFDDIVTAVSEYVQSRHGGEEFSVNIRCKVRTGRPVDFEATVDVSEPDDILARLQIRNNN